MTNIVFGAVIAMQALTWGHNTPTTSLAKQGDFFLSDRQAWSAIPSPWTYRIPETPESGTEQISVNAEIFVQAQEIFAAGKYDDFEDGFESKFSRALQVFVRRNGFVAVAALQNLILLPETNLAVSAEALRWLGQIEQPSSYSARMSLLMRSLSHPSGRVRDGAVLGLSSLDDPKSLTFLRGAIKEEPIQELRDDMIQLQHQLEETARWRSSFAK